MTVVEWLLLGALLLLLALVIGQIVQANRTAERVEVLRHGVFEYDRDFWAERLGWDPDRPLLNDGPEPEGPPDCDDRGKVHVPILGSNVCQVCSKVLV